MPRALRRRAFPRSVLHCLVDVPSMPTILSPLAAHPDSWSSRMRRVTPFALALVIAVGACRDDPTGPPQEDAITPAVTAPATPHFLVAKTGAPIIANPVIHVYAKRGQRSTVYMLYHARAGQKD